MKRFILAAFLWVFAGSALAVQAPPAVPTAPPSNTVVPTNAASPHSFPNLAALLNPSPFARADYISKPYGNAQLVTNRAANLGTLYVTLEVPSDFNAGELDLANILPGSWTITSAAIAPSSQLAAPSSITAATRMFGVSAFDAAGNDITSTAFQVLSFGNAGKKGAFAAPPNTYTNVQGTAVASSCSGSTLTTQSTTGSISIGQTAQPTSPNTSTMFGDGLSYTVTGVSGSNITLNGTPACGAGDTWQFLPMMIAVAGTTNPNIPAHTWTDPFYIQSVPRIDGPVASGEVPYIDGQNTPIVNGMTANVVGATSVSLSGGTIPSKIDAGTNIRFCTPVTTSGTLTPINSFSLSAGQGSAVSANMYAMLGISIPSTSVAYLTAFVSQVSGVASDTVTLADNIGPSPGGPWSGTMIFASSAPTMAATNPALTVNGIFSSGNITLNDPNGILTSWQSAIAAGASVFAVTSNLQGTGSNGIQVTAINSSTKVLTMASWNGGLSNGQPILLYMQRTISGTITPPYNLVMTTGPANNILPGSLVVGSAWKAQTHTLLNFTFNDWRSLSLDKPPTSTISSGASVVVCHAKMKLTQAALAGATSLSFAQTNYRYRLLLVRINYAFGVSATITNGSASIAATNTFTAGQPVAFANISGPTNLNNGVTYYVLSTGLSGSAFQVASSLGGAAIVPNGSSAANVAQNSTLYQGPGNDWGAAIDNGLPAFYAGYCNSILDGVLNPSSVSNTTGGCYSSLTNPVFAVRLVSPTAVISVMNVGDSKFQGATTPYNSLWFGELAAADLWSEVLPFSSINDAWSGGPGALFAPLAQQDVSLFNPSILVIQGVPNNWPSSANGYSQAVGATEALAAQQEGQHGLSVIADDYPGGGWGFTTFGAINSNQVKGRQWLAGFSVRGRPYFDTTNVVGLTSSGGAGPIAYGSNAYLNMQYSGDGLHLLLSGHQALMTPFETLVAPYVMQP